MRRSAVGLVVTALVFAAAGCGSSSDSGGGDNAPTKAEYITQADAICKAGNDKIDAAAKKLGASPSADQITTFAKSELIPDLQEQVDGLKKLTAPTADKATIAAMVSKVEAGLATLKADPIKVASQSESPFAAANAAAKAYGLKVCGSDG